MQWLGRRQSSNIEDRRGFSYGKGAALGGGGLIMALIAVFVFGADPAAVFQDLQSQQGPTTQASGNYQASPQEQKVFEFVSVVLADTEDTWADIFAKQGNKYKMPQLVVYSNSTPTACGTGQASSGPFYCPEDEKIYLDLSFLNELQRMGASGDLAVAYVLAHEVGHHVQTMTGISDKVRQLQARSSQTEANGIQMKMELQADCLAGVWVNHTQKRTQFLEKGDIEEALQAAAAVGDDTIMRKAGIPPRREAFTHGSSKERMSWFDKGVQAGTLGSCAAGIEPR